MKLKLTRPKMKPVIFFAIGILLMVCAVLMYTHPWQGKENVAWDVTLVGADGQQKVLTYHQMTTMPAYTGNGGFFTTAGIVNGPYKAKGVPLTDLCNLVGGVTSSDTIIAYASDGYSSIFSYNQVTGDIVTYDPKTMKEVLHGELKLILMYEQDGKSLSQDGGKPLRVAIVGTDGLLTEGNMWIKWVNKIAVMKVSQLQ